MLTKRRLIGSVGVGYGSDYVDLLLGRGAFLNDVSGVGLGPCEPLECGDYKGVPARQAADNSRRSGSIPVTPGQARIDRDPLRCHLGAVAPSR